MIIKGNSVAPEQIGNGHIRKILVHAGKLMSVECCFERGFVVQTHQHPHEQLTYVISGKYEVSVNDQKEILFSGDSFYTAPEEAHGVVVLEAGTLLDTFTPQREDFLLPSA
jgi:quercetin dioxygenase-like cupin family protein